MSRVRVSGEEKASAGAAAGASAAGDNGVTSRTEPLELDLRLFRPLRTPDSTLNDFAKCRQCAARAISVASYIHPVPTSGDLDADGRGLTGDERSFSRPSRAHDRAAGREIDFRFRERSR